MPKPKVTQVQTSESNNDPAAQAEGLIGRQREMGMDPDERIDELARFVGRLAGAKGGNLSGLPGGLNVTVTVQVQIPGVSKAQDDKDPARQKKPT